MSDNIYFRALVAKQAYHLNVPILKKRTMFKPMLKPDLLGW
jgi:hypothetical protein